MHTVCSLRYFGCLPRTNAWRLDHVADYIRKYYPAHSVGIDAASAYQACAEGLAVHDLGDLVSLGQARLAAGLEQTSLLEALTAHHGDDAPAVIEAQFDRLVRYCQPFWRYNADSGIVGYEGKSIIGVQDEHSPLIPAKYRNHTQYELKSTGFRHEIGLVRIQHGLPAFLLHGMSEWKSHYDARRGGIDPLHVLPEALHAREVTPEAGVEERMSFAVAAAFGYIVQLGTWYYYDPEKRVAGGGRRPSGKRLGQGRQNAEEAFVHDEELVRQADEAVEREIQAIGNERAIALLGERIEALNRYLDTTAAESDLSRQIQDEIEALKAKQRQLTNI